jgi:sulfite exporter TauE/SafE
MPADLLGSLAGTDGVGLVAFFVVGLLGGAHCLGMCGPLVTMYADRMGTEQSGARPGRAPATDGRGAPRAVGWHEIRQHALFNAGRTASYAAVGAAVGAAGGLVFDAAALASVGDAVRAAVGLAVGTVVVTVGVRYLLGGAAGLPGVAALPLVGPLLTRLTERLTARADRLAGGPGIVGLGAVHGLLPCPLLYPAYLYAFGRGSALAGGLSLLALGLGTFPTLFAYGVAVGSLGTGTRRGLHRALGAAFVLLGLIPLANALALLGVAIPHPPLPMPALNP